jgi:holo-[acyl-carrier protein] synthase
MIIGIGVDLIETIRIETIFKKWGSVFSRKILSKKELHFFSNCVATSSPSNEIAYLAKRFTAKEAIGKALGLGIRYPVSFKSIEILNDHKGRPYPEFHNKLKEFCDRKQYKLHLTISDQKKYAQALAIVEYLGNS